MPVWGLRRRSFVRSVPGYRSVLEDGSGSVEGCFYGMPDKWKALWGLLATAAQKRPLHTWWGLPRPLVSVASLLLKNHRSGLGTVFALRADRAWKRYGRESEKKELLMKRILMLGLLALSPLVRARRSPKRAKV